MTTRAIEQARAIAESALIPGKVHNLEGTIDADALPAEWDGTQVGIVIVNAFAILDRLPEPPGARGFGMAWPEYAYDTGDVNGWQSLPLTELAERKQRMLDRWSRPPPSAEEVSRMEAAFAWLAELRTIEPGAATCVRLWAFAKHRDLDTRRLCHRKGIAHSTFYRKREHGLNTVALWLRQRSIAVFGC